MRDLLISWRLPLYFCVTATTRAMRPGEVNGVDYHFLSEEEFDRLEAADGFIEHANVYGKRYGVPRDEIVSHLGAGQDVVARVDVQGAASLRQLYPDALLIFIAPPSLMEARRRLDQRDSDSDEQKQLRMDTAAFEMEAARSFDHIVVNETGALEATARKIVELIAAAKRRRI